GLLGFVAGAIAAADAIARRRRRAAARPQLQQPDLARATTQRQIAVPRVSDTYVRVRPPTDEQRTVHRHAPGYVRVATNPWSWATADGQRIDPVDNQPVLPAGRHALQLVCGGNGSSRSVVRNVDVRPNETTQVSFDWDKELEEAPTDRE